jgi:hypothetical protein
VYDDRLQARRAQEHHVGRERLRQRRRHHGVAAELHHRDRAPEAAEPRQRFDEDGGLLLRREVCAHEEYSEFSRT